MADRLPGQPGRGREVREGGNWLSRLLREPRFRTIAILLVLLLGVSLVRLADDDAAEEQAATVEAPAPVASSRGGGFRAGRVSESEKPEAASLRGVYVYGDETITFVPSWEEGRWAGYVRLSGVSTQWLYNVHQGKVMIFTAGYQEFREFDLVSSEALREGEHVFVRQTQVHKKSDAPESAASSEPDGSE